MLGLKTEVYNINERWSCETEWMKLGSVAVDPRHYYDTAESKCSSNKELNRSLSNFL